MTYNILLLVYQNLLNHSPNEWENEFLNLAIISGTE